MIESVLQYLNNWFVVARYDDTYTIEDGNLTLPFLVNGQYFRIVGSLFNDGVYQYPAELTDEAFNGSIWALAVPRGVITLTDEITACQAKNGEAGPYSSESFGGYSYSRLTNAHGQAASWQHIFTSRLAPWKKLPGNYAYAEPNPHMTPPVPNEPNPWR